MGMAGLLPPWECAQAGRIACYLNAFVVHAVFNVSSQFKGGMANHFHVADKISSELILSFYTSQPRTMK